MYILKVMKKYLEKIKNSNYIKKDNNNIEKPKSGYWFYYKNEVDNIKKINPSLSNKEIVNLSVFIDSLYRSITFFVLVPILIFAPYFHLVYQRSSHHFDFARIN